MAKKTKVVVPASWFAGGWLPPVCAKTGKPTTDTRKANAEYMHPLAFAGLFMGLLGFLILHMITRKRVAGIIPFAGGNRTSRNQTIAGVVVLLASVASFFGLATRNELLQSLGLLGFLGLFVGFGLVFVGSSNGVNMKLSKDQSWVTMNKVHPEFAAATTALLQQATAAAAAPVAAAPVRPAESFVLSGPPAMAGNHDPFGAAN